MWKAQTKEAILREIKIREWRRRMEKRIVSALSWLLVNVARAVVMSLEWLKVQSTKIAHDIEMNRLLSQRHDKLFRLGETIYAMYRSGEISWETIEPICQEIEAIDRQVESMRVVPLEVLPQGPGRREILQEKGIVSQ